VPRICFVTCRTWPEISESDRLAQRALEARGDTVLARAWNDPAAAFTGFDAVVLRSNWDYHLDPAGFLHWLDRRERDGARVFNPPALVRWNLTKGYLLELAGAGVPTVPTAIVARPGRAELLALMEARRWDRIVMKPLIGASAHDTRLITADTLDAALAPGAGGRPAVVQPFVEAIRTAGEWSLIFIDGQETHAVLKRPAAGDFRVQPRLGGTARAGTPPGPVRAAARAALRALPAAPLYARVDGVETGEGFLIMEVEVNEPGLFFPYAPAAAERFAEALRRRLGPTGHAVQ
jgi:glutathione synthase/RimK-type ligase-like ATP-grasp enzyme